MTSPYDSLVKTGSLAARKSGEIGVSSLPVPVVAVIRRLYMVVVFARDSAVTATNSTVSPAAGPGDPATSNIYQKSPDLSIIK